MSGVRGFSRPVVVARKRHARYDGDLVTKSEPAFHYPRRQIDDGTPRMHVYRGTVRDRLSRNLFVRVLIALLLFSALSAGEAARLQELADTRQLFLLREALQQP